MAERERPLLLVGAGGQVGRRLAAALSGAATLRTTTRRDLDLEDLDAVRALVRTLAPRLVVNAAAYTAVDAAESDADRAMTINADAAGVLAEEARALGAPIVHLSTNYVFDGALGRPYREDDAPHPLGVYGASKARGEERVAEGNPQHVILRTAAIYDWTGSNFFLRMCELAREREELRVVNDQFVSPTPAAELASAIARIIMMMETEGASFDRYGTYHLTARGRASWHEFAERLLALDPRRDEHRVRRLLPVSSAEYPTAARRPLNGILDMALVTERFGIELPAWEDALRTFVASHGDAA